MKTTIEVYKKSVYGNALTYIVDPEIAKTFFKLTGHKVLVDYEREALEELGFKFVVVLDPSLK